MNPPVGNFRWTVCALLFFATTVNYLDRAVISLVKEYLDAEFLWTKSDYADITIAFQLSYALAMIFVGRIIDRLGVKRGYSISLSSWSLATMGHFLVTGNFGFFVARVALGVTESGNFPAAIKTVSEWFPKKERALATGIFNAGTNVGAILAPLSVPYIASAYGWRSTFLITGAFGLIWLFFWQRLYASPLQQKRLSAAERAYIQGDADETPATEAVQRAEWKKILTLKQAWAFACGKFLTDGIWWFYLFWLPDFLKEQYHLSKTELAFPVATVYLLAAAGSVWGGWLPMYFIGKGLPVFKARKTAMFLYAFFPLPVVLAQWAGAYNMWAAICIIGLAAAGHQAWSANIFTTVSDMFPKRAVGFVTGLGGMCGTLGAVLVAKTAGWLFDYYKGLGHIETGYYIMFIVSGIAYLAAWGVMQLLAPRMEKAVW